MKTYTTNATHAQEMKNAGSLHTKLKDANAELKEKKNQVLYPEMYCVAKVVYTDCFGNKKSGGYCVSHIHDDHLN